MYYQSISFPENTFEIADEKYIGPGYEAKNTLTRLPMDSIWLSPPTGLKINGTFQSNDNVYFILDLKSTKKGNAIIHGQNFYLSFFVMQCMESNL